MTTATIATTDSATTSEWGWEPSDVIALTARPDSAAIWDRCINALLAIWNGGPTIPDPAPSNAAIDAAIRFLQKIRRHDPTNTPIWIRPDPDGGVILEWRHESDAGTRADTVTFFNDDTVEFCRYVDDVACETRRISTDAIQ